MPQLVSVNVGLPRDVSWNGETVHTAIWKAPVTGPCTVRRLNLDGDGQGDLGGHGGEHRAVMVYQLDSYRYWQQFLKRDDFTYGQFGENFTVDGLADDEVCIGDRYRVGTAVFEVTQPRVTCYRVGLRMNDARMPSLLVQHHRPGFYFRVIQKGIVNAGDQIVLLAKGAEALTVAEVDALLYLPDRSRDKLERTLRIPALSPGWRGSFQQLLEQSDATPAGTARPAWTGYKPLTVARTHHESDSVLSFELVLPDGTPLPPALPGQSLAVRLHMPSGVVLRNYSISSAPGGSSYRISVKLQQNGLGSGFLHTSATPGQTVECSVPRGSFVLQPGDAPLVLLSAGIGATPVLAMLHALAAQSSSRPIWWIHAARNSREHPFADEVRGLLAKLPGSCSFIAYSRPLPEDVAANSFQHNGHLGIEQLDTLSIPSASEVYLCGPTAFTRDVTAGLLARGFSQSRIYSETFGLAASLTPGIAAVSARTPHLPQGAPGTGPEVTFARSGLAVPWDARFPTLLELAEACDVPVRWACRSGVCHTCITPVLGGSIRYAPAPLDPPAEGSALICCAQPDGDLQLDL